MLENLFKPDIKKSKLKRSDYLFINQDQYIPLLKKHNITRHQFLKMVEVDDLSIQELQDLNYVDDRIETHLSNH